MVRALQSAAQTFHDKVGGNLTHIGGSKFGAVLALDQYQVEHLLRGTPSVGRKRELIDVLVVGAGLSGSLVGQFLGAKGINTLVLEAGSIPVGDQFLSNEHKLASGTIYERLVRRPGGPSDSDYVGGEYNALGGKANLWGGLALRALPWELRQFPKSVASYLGHSATYERAERIANVKTVELESDLQRQVIVGLRRWMSDRTWGHQSAAYAVSSDCVRTLRPTGMFNPAEPLLKAKLERRNDGQRDTLSVLLNQRVINIRRRNSDSVMVAALNVATGEMREFQARNVVLAAGAVGSAALAIHSNLADQAGVGLTDHPILYQRFTIRPGSEFYDPSQRSKTVTRHLNASPDRHRYNMLLELNTAKHESHFAHMHTVAGPVSDTTDRLSGRQSQSDEHPSMTSEIVFILHQSRNPANNVVVDSAGRPYVSMSHSGVSEEEKREMQAIADEVIGKLGGVPLRGQETLQTASLGCVAHEIGSMAMGVVTDDHLRVIGCDNIFVSDLSAMNFSPAANPSLTMVAMAFRLAKDLVDRVSARHN